MYNETDRKASTAVYELAKALLPSDALRLFCDFLFPRVIENAEMELSNNKGSRPPLETKEGWSGGRRQDQAERTALRGSSAGACGNEEEVRYIAPEKATLLILERRSSVPERAYSVS